MSLYRRVMGTEPPGQDAPPVEIAASASQFAGILLTRLAESAFGADVVEFSRAITSGQRTSKRPRGELRAELRRFLDLSPQGRDVVIPMWLNLNAFPLLPWQALRMAEAYGLDPVDVGHALLVGLDLDRTETLCHVAGMTGLSAFTLVCNAVQIEQDAQNLSRADRYMAPTVGRLDDTYPSLDLPEITL